MRKRTTLQAALIAALIALTGCGGSGEPVDVAGDALPGAVDAPIRTSAAEYTYRAEAGGYAVDIPITYRNPLDEPLHIVNCRGGLAPSLEKREDGQWRTFWTGVQLMCLSPPIVVEAGGSLSDTVRILGGLSGGDMFPVFESDELEGTYRIVLHNVVLAGDASAAQPGGDVGIEHRVSNPFTLRAP